MDLALHKRIKLFSLLAVFISFAGTAGGLLLKLDFFEVLAVTSMLPAFSIISVVTSYVIIHQDKEWLRKIRKYGFLICLLSSIASVAALVIFFKSTLAIAMAALVLYAVIIVSLIYIFVFSDPVALKWSVAFILIITFSIIIKRFHLPFAGIILTLSLLLFSMGCYIYGIRAMFLAEKVNYLKYVSFFSSCIVTISFLGLLYKLQRWPGGDILIQIGNISLIVGTLIVLLTLSSSGIINWKTLHRKMLIRLLLPWVFIFSLFIIRFMLPELNTIIWQPDRVWVAPFGFNMSDYEIEKKNGLE